MTIQSISEEVRRIQKKYGESDPFRLAQAMKIIVVLKPMGRYKGCCKGFYVQHRRIKHITINSDLPELIKGPFIFLLRCLLKPFHCHFHLRRILFPLEI